MKFKMYIKTVKTYIKDPKKFLSKLTDLGILLGNVILCVVNVVGLYANIPHEEGLLFLTKNLDLIKDIKVNLNSDDGKARIFLNNTFISNKKTYRQ